ncbi:methionine ABC transporter ATP-binding protein [Fructilactobacillus lindneri]|uniref:Methionine import ATP-binding protein metN n=2 Tax=Fructilactobacillus lindneri TaxID=53444 RepID=A0A0R2JTS0_9LACO|nr:methionine ABC transporter ATP-binding protein [Fructilactobacillus lindneri]ANZ57522.1 methionine ABC transporter ATP-binding protein [Fructilactobacillus lindneri]ANZ58790.1 methionine ABC transporter ATP-binding protein [Fructilactobacillus lindneri]KRN80511.1 methionine import ATP-binding protein metN [Fructilactobacillus lindneri DSM 20690 = JCM 11027]POG97782.1 methionine ABC transporter ATP-binding protein [Fructilactobacillus lindneri]POG99114.1 methionine ABC transporter ATP-bindin
MANDIVQFKDVSVDFKQDKKVVQAVSDVSFGIPEGQIFGIAGYSGAGKSTLVRTINLLQKPTSGEVDVFGEIFYKKVGKEVTLISESKLRKERRKIGMIFQHYNLLDEKTVQQNVEFALKHSGLKSKQISEKAVRLLTDVGLEKLAKYYPSQLSGGQQQRVAIARALANDPKILISDEATSALDPENTIQILDLLKDLNRKYQLTVILITHEMDAIKRICDEVAIMDSGKVVEIGSLIDIFVKSTNPVVRQIVGNDFDALSILKSLNIDTNNRNLVKLVYYSQEISQPIIVDLYAKFNVSASIVYADIEEFGSQTVGIMIVDLNGDDAQIKQALDYLNGLDVEVTELRGEA